MFLYGTIVNLRGSVANQNREKRDVVMQGPDD